MRAVDLIIKKRDGGHLTREEIRFLVEGYTRGEVADYQMAAFLMAVYFKGMSLDETSRLPERERAACMVAAWQRRHDADPTYCAPGWLCVAVTAGDGAW